MTKLQRLGAGLLALIMFLLPVNPALAQELHSPTPSTSTAPSTATAPAQAGTGRVIALQDLGATNPADLDIAGNDPCKARSLESPRAARSSTIAGDTPLVDKNCFTNRFFRSNPAAADAAWNSIESDNERRCKTGAATMQELGSIQTSFGSDEEDLKFLQSVYEDLSPTMKRSTRIMQTSQAVQAGFLCVLSAGTYCLAAVTGAVGNITVAEANLKLQLANIKLSVMNILITRRNVRLQSISVELVGEWIPVFMPMCVRMGYITPADILATKRAAMDPVETIDSPLLQHDRARYVSNRDRRSDARR